MARATTGRDPQEALSALFRAVHTLKGNARIFKIASVQDAAHDFETRFHTPGEGEPGASSPEAFAEMEGELAALRALVDEFGALLARRQAELDHIAFEVATEAEAVTAQIKRFFHTVFG